ncbi:MAG: 50S ribosomal protein L9 [Coxiellaceae bacterium]|jgi:large subunit ribosomal protein L9|nr:50S ribosomal protein L9 [Coxiellaceae bacterium]
MEIILLEKIRNLGDIGAKVTVRPGHARNYLIPYGKAVIATQANLEKFAKMREEFERNAAEALRVAKERANKLEKAIINIPVKATEEGKLFGSINTSTIANALKNIGFEVKRSEISMPSGVIRQVGEYEVALLLHSDVTVKIKVNVSPTEIS